MDHAGNLGVLRKDIPIVASPQSLAIMKGMQDAGISSIESDTIYFSTRQPDDNLGLYLKSVSSMNYLGRDFYCTGPLSEEMKTFLSSRPGQDSPKVHKKLEPGKRMHYREATLPFEVSPYPVDHSILGATAYILRGDTTIAYTGDFRLHGKNGDLTREFVKRAKDASVLIIEGTRAGPSSGKEKVTEQSVCEICRRAAENSSGLIIADFSPRNFERLEDIPRDCPEDQP
jgi:ribonuclease J